MPFTVIVRTESKYLKQSNRIQSPAPLVVECCRPWVTVHARLNVEVESEIEKKLIKVTEYYQLEAIKENCLMRGLTASKASLGAKPTSGQIPWIN